MLHWLPGTVLVLLSVAPWTQMGRAQSGGGQTWAPGWLPNSPYPQWSGLVGGAGPGGSVRLVYDGSLSPGQNGDRLYAAIAALQAGDELRVGPGVWSVRARLDLSIAATESRPVRVVGDDPSRRPVLTRPDANQNVLNVGSTGPSRYLVLQDLVLTGGSDLLRLYDVQHLWLDRCALLDGGGVGIAAQTHRCAGLFVTDNEIARPGPGTNGEGMYLGAGTPAVAVTDSVIAFNHVHDTRGAVANQGDGIELKQGCTRNWVLGNRVHGTRNPGILLYGTGGIDENVVEGNLLYDSDDAPLQVQGEALVRNNLVVAMGQGFQSHDHQGSTRDLQLVHNTIVSVGRAVHLAHWGGRQGMVLANNAIYSLTASAVHFGAGAQGVTMAANVVMGPIYGGGAVAPGSLPSGFLSGGGLADFVDLDPRSVGGSTPRLDAAPRVGGRVDNRGDPRFLLAVDRLGRERLLPVDPGALTNGPTLIASAPSLPVAGGSATLTSTLGAGLAGCSYIVMGSASGTAGGLVVEGFHLPLVDDWLFDATLYGSLDRGGLLAGGIGVLDGLGALSAQLVVPRLDPAVAGLELVFSVAVFDPGTGPVRHVSNPVAVPLVP